VRGSERKRDEPDHGTPWSGERFTKTCELLDIAKSSLRRYLTDERKIPGDAARRALSFLIRSEFESIVGELRALGAVRGDGTVDYGVILKILAVAARDEDPKNAILRFVV